MSTIVVNSGFISKYIKDNHKHSEHKECVRLYDSMRIHSDGEFPGKLIGERRPSESKLLFDYRQKIYEPQTVGPFSKVQNSLSKIRKSQDWSIKYSTDISAKINKSETLENYCELTYPDFTSISNWFFSEGMKNYLIDSNGLIVVTPEYLPSSESEYVKPIACIYNSNDVIDYVENDYAVLKSEEVNKFIENNVEYEGEVYLIITTDEIWKSKQINLKRDFKTELFYRHDLGFLPCRQMKGEFKEKEDYMTLYKSRLSSCLPSWNEAVREYSDMQASVVKHMFPTMVIHTNSKCTQCSGTGKKIVAQGRDFIACEHCKGKGSTPTSPYEDIEVRPQSANELPLPSPIAYYIDKGTAIITIQDERIDKHIYKGYAAVNFEFLAVGLNQSGVAKELDRSELNAFIYSIAEDIVSILDDVYYFINEYRYRILIPSQEERDKNLPTINVPEKYDIISETYLSDEIAKAKTNKINAFIINALEIEYANKKFNTDPKVRDLVRLSLELDPLTGMTEDEKMVKLQNGGILKQDYVISNYIISFVRRAINEVKEFGVLLYSEQINILRKYADEIITKAKPILPASAGQ